MSPKLLDLQLATLTVYPNVGEHRSRREEVLRELESLWKTHSFDDGITACLVCKTHDNFLGGSLADVNRVICAQLLRDFQTIRVPIDGNDEAGRVQLRRYERRQPDRSNSDDGDRRTRLHLPIEHSTFQSRGQDITQHHQTLLIDPFRDMMQPAVRQRYPDILCLCPVHRVAQNPPAFHAVAVAAFAAVLAASAARDAVDQHMIAFLEA